MVKGLSVSVERTPTICIIGAGFSGLTIAIQLKRKLGLATFKIYDKNSDIGGAWLVNNYPGAAADGPAHYYSWSFAPNKNAQRIFPTQEQMLEYIKGVAGVFDIYSHFKGNTKVIGAIWVEKQKQWNVKTINTLTQGENEEFFDFVIVGMSPFWNPNKPRMFDSFTGPKMHSAEWDHSVDLESKVIGVVGSGASTVQIIPATIEKVKELHSFQRQPAWVLPKPDVVYSKSTRWMFNHIPFIITLERSLGSLISQAAYFGVMSSLVDRMARSAGTKYIKWQTSARPEVAEQLMPTDVQVFCRYPSGSIRYYPAMASAKVTIHRERILSVRGNTILFEDGKEQKLDVLILATGFKMHEFFGPLQIIGESGEDILKSWTSDRPRTYYGLCSKSAKNLFFIAGPQSLCPYNSAILAMECQANYIVKLLREMMKQRYRICRVKPEYHDKFNSKYDKMMSKTIWGDARCQETLEGNKGFHTVAYPGSVWKYWAKTRKPNFSKFDFAY